MLRVLHHLANSTSSINKNYFFGLNLFIKWQKKNVKSYIRVIK